MAAAAITPQIHLLSSAKLRMTETLSRGQPEPNVVVLRPAGDDRRLVVTPAQADILTADFSDYKTVPEVLARSIAENRCPPLREFYELVVQAHAAGLLRTEPAPEEKPRVIHWPVRCSVRLATFFAGSAAVISAGFLAGMIPRWRGPDTWVDVVGGWLAACALLSLGELLAACTIAVVGEVRAAQLCWRTRFPHFQIDTAEAIMGGRTCEVAVAALRAAPVLVGAAIAAWKVPGWLPALGGGALFVLAPFGPTAARQWLASRRKAPQYSIRADFLFEPARADLWARWSARCRAFLAEFGWWGLAWTLIWLAWLATAFTHCMPRTAATVEAWARGAPRPVHLGAEYLLLAAIALGLVAGVWAGIQHVLHQRAWSKPLRGADAREPNRPPLTGDRAEMLAQVPLFQGLHQDLRTALAAATEAVVLGRRVVVFREDDPGEDFYVIVDGEVAVKKRLPNRRRSVVIGWLGPGDCFGEIALLENTARTATLVTSRPTRLLKLGRAQFDRLVVGGLGPAPVRELLQQARFLGRFTFAAGWSFTELVKFAQRCRSVRIDKGDALLRQGDPNQWFYLIYDGAFEASQDGRVLRCMGPGDYFGEISLLEGWSATATVVAMEESRCLALDRSDFLEFFARDFRIGLRMEALAERRLGSRIFASR